jgi:hypothetical protein
MSCDIVIAHYRENIDWVFNLSFKNITNIYIYSKDDKVSKPKVCDLPIVKHKYLPNIGRESHTYLTYCIDNYTSLSDFVIFLQGDPSAHGYGTNVINNWINQSLDANFTHTKNYREYALDWALNNGRLSHWYTPTQPSKYNIYDWFSEYITKDNIAKHRIYYSANFGIRKEYIVSRPLEDYYLLINNELNTINPEAGHYMERSWYHFFNLHRLAT